MRSDKGEAFLLRRNGKSYREIEAKLGVAKSTLSNWFKGVDFSEAIKDELTKEVSKKHAKRMQVLNKTRGIALQVQYEQAAKEAQKEIKLYRNLPLFTTGLGIYWGAGDTQNERQIRLSDTDPAVLKVFLAFLTQLCGVEEEKIRLALFIGTDVNEAKCKRYWRKQLGSRQFYKTQLLPTKTSAKRSPYGACMVVVSNSYIKKKLDTWIDHLPEMVLNTVPKKKK